jgi:hypothetical protein
MKNGLDDVSPTQWTGRLSRRLGQCLIAVSADTEMSTGDEDLTRTATQTNHTLVDFKDVGGTFLDWRWGERGRRFRLCLRCLRCRTTLACAGRGCGTGSSGGIGWTIDNANGSLDSIEGRFSPRPSNKYQVFTINLVPSPGFTNVTWKLAVEVVVVDIGVGLSFRRVALKSNPQFSF